ncbi:MAG TPA: hypothetical protein VEA37_01375, partial [Flavobacterium sp.]|nr:hypothetical protein [Flavobacterium sp.]
MKKLVLPLIVCLLTSISYSQIDNATKNDLKDVIKEAQKEYDESQKDSPYTNPNNVNKGFNKPEIVSQDTYKIDNDNFHIVKAEIKDNQYVITYFDNKGKLKIYYENTTHNDPIDTEISNTFKSPYISAMTVPIKIRPRDGEIPSSAKADIDNIGVYLSWGKEYEKWYYDDTTITKKWSGGIFIAPTFEKLDKSNAPNLTYENSNQVYLTLALAATFTYENITFAVIPIGFD